jgi:hypothetical protein
MFLSKTIIGLRFKTDTSMAIHPNMHLFYKYGIYNTAMIRKYNLENTTSENGYVFFNHQALILKAIRSYGNVEDSIFSRFVFAGFRGVLSIFC